LVVAHGSVHFPVFVIGGVRSACDRSSGIWQLSRTLLVAYPGGRTRELARRVRCLAPAASGSARRLTSILAYDILVYEVIASPHSGSALGAAGSGKTDECIFCRASCPSRDAFKEPDSGLPLKCDMCESDPSIEVPMCVQWCLADALIYDEREEEVEEEAEEIYEVDAGLEALANIHGWSKVLDAVTRLAKKP